MIDLKTKLLEILPAMRIHNATFGKADDGLEPAWSPQEQLRPIQILDLTLRPEEHTILEPGHSRYCAKVAQLVEHTTENRSVGSSILPFGTT
jgi:hypothetical protein